MLPAKPYKKGSQSGKLNTCMVEYAHAPLVFIIMLSVKGPIKPMTTNHSHSCFIGYTLCRAYAKTSISRESTYTCCHRTEIAMIISNIIPKEKPIFWTFISFTSSM